MSRKHTKTEQMGWEDEFERRAWSHSLYFPLVSPLSSEFRPDLARAGSGLCIVSCVQPMAKDLRLKLEDLATTYEKQL